MPESFRAGMKRIVQEATGRSDADTEIILRRIADRLGGYTHEEAVVRHPLADDVVRPRGEVTDG
jgi:hypothetical protein